MKNPNEQDGQQVNLLDGRSVWLGPYKDTGDFVIQFERPVRKTDFENGIIVPSMKAFCQEQSLMQQVRITPQSAHALWLLLNEHFNNENATETIEVDERT